MATFPSLQSVRSLRRIAQIGILSLGLSMSSGLLAAPAVSPVTGVPVSGYFSLYFQNATTPVCSGASVIQSFNTVTTSYMRPVCVNVNTLIYQYLLAHPFTPAGANGQVQFNSGGIFGASSSFVWDTVHNRLGVGVMTPTVSLDVSGGGQFSGKVTSSATVSSDPSGVLTTKGYVDTRLATLNNGGLFWKLVGTNTIALSGASLTRVQLGETTSSQVLIGTTTPNVGAMLTVAGAAQSRATTDTDQDLTLVTKKYILDKLNAVPRPTEVCTGSDKALQWDGTKFSCTTLLFMPLPTYTLTFDGNGGTGHTPITMIVNSGSTLSTLPTNPTRSGYTFNGWYTAQTGGKEIATTTKPTADTTYYARWAVMSTEGGGTTSCVAYGPAVTTCEYPCDVWSKNGCLKSHATNCQTYSPCTKWAFCGDWGCTYY